MSGFGLGLAGLKIAAKLSGAKAVLAKVPAKVWYVLAAIAALVGAYLVHQHVAHNRLQAADAGGYARRKSEDDTKLAQAHADASAWKARAEQQGVAIAQLNKEKHDAEIRSHAAVADALRVRGPGAAASHCGPVDHPAAAAVAGRRNEAAADPNAAGSQVPAGDWATVPWSWLVQRAQEFDDLLTGETTRRAADKQQREAWDKMRSAPPTP